MIIKGAATDVKYGLNDSNNGHPNTFGIITINSKVNRNVTNNITSNKNCLKFGYVSSYIIWLFEGRSSTIKIEYLGLLFLPDSFPGFINEKFLQHIGIPDDTGRIKTFNIECVACNLIFINKGDIVKFPFQRRLVHN